MAFLIRVIGISLLLSGVIARADEVGEGDALSRITLADRNGEDVEIRGDAAPVVIVEFWASWCLPCRKTVPAIVAPSKP